MTAPRCSYCARPAAPGVSVVRPEGRWPACDGCASRVLGEFPPVERCEACGAEATQHAECWAGADSVRRQYREPVALCGMCALAYRECFGAVGPCDPTADLDSF